ncbi:MAG: LysM peptidoglycan-binding domain-containing protein [Candidatus Berkelbacteria bacterium]|nr:MAG: LysM peptidoglycan-binding domain-containing protein [Candidatus Berkelbacteria bacterium]
MNRLINGADNSRLFLRSYLARPQTKRVRKFIRRYSTQLSFGSFILVFLTFSVGEGQAYDPNFYASSIIDEQIEAQAAGFVGKPQLFIGQTILTGEVQQLYAFSYTVEKGDSLMGIAGRYNTTVAQLIETNNIAVADIEKIKPGTEILIPSSEKPDSTSLAWLDELNAIKEKEREAARQAELEKQRRLQRNQRTTTPRSGGTRVASYGDYTVVGKFTNLPTNGAFRGQCTNWVKYKRPDLPAKMGNGGQYPAYARLNGIPVKSSPAVGDVAVTWESPVGHVAYVEGFDAQYVYVSEMNFAGWAVVTKRAIPRGNVVAYVGRK